MLTSTDMTNRLLLDVFLFTMLMVQICYAEPTIDDWSNGHKPVEFFLNTQATVQHLESDMYIKGNILFCEYQAILTTNGHYQQVVVGQHFRWPIYPYAEGIGVNATFSKVSHFVQKNETMVIIADKDNGCIRQLDRLTNSTVCLAGVCEKLTGISQKVVDGKRLDATFRRIDSMALYGSKLYIIESNAQRIRLLDFTTEQVSTVVTSSNFTLSHHKPHTMVVNPITGLMYVTTTYGIAEYNPGSNVFRYMVSYQQKGHQDGMLNESRWYYNDGMVFLINKTLIVADVNNENLRIIDLEAERVATWCFDNPRTISNCTITKPKALGVIDCTVYITTNRKISTIALPEGHCLRQQAEEDQISLTSVPNWVLNKKAIAIGCGVTVGIVIIVSISGVVLYCMKRRQSFSMTSSNTDDLSVYYNSISAEQEEKKLNVKKGM